MINELLIRMPTVLASLPTAAERAQAKQHGDSKTRFLIQLLEQFENFDWRWLAYFTAAALIIFGIILFGALSMRKLQAPRLGFFIYTSTVFVVRIVRPGDRAWLAFAAAGAALSMILIVTIHLGKRKVNRKEPVYYLLNTFTLVILSTNFSMHFAVLAGMALALSLFFITTKNPTPHHKYKSTDADPYILESLEKRAQRNI